MITALATALDAFYLEHWIIVGLLGLMLAGCAVTYTKRGATQEEFSRDRAAAMGTSLMGGTANPFAASREVMQRCMESKGSTPQ
jgi:hypothetical protein